MAESTSSWVETMALKRRSNASNVFLVETFDNVRRLAMEAQSAEWFTELFQPKTNGYESVFVYDAQREELDTVELVKKLKDDRTGIPELDAQGREQMIPRRVPVEDIEGSNLEFIHKELQAKSNVVLIDYIFMSSQVERLARYLAAWSHNDGFYRKRSTVIVFTASASLFPDALRKMLYTIQVPPSTADERREILTALKGQLQKQLTIDDIGEVTEELLKASAGLNLHQVESAAIESAVTMRKFDVKAFTAEKVKVLSDYGIRYVEPTRGFESVGGYETLKKYVRERIIAPLKNPELAAKYGQELPRGLLLYGVAGCGKTWISRALSKELTLPMLELQASDFMSSLYGETESRVRQITQLIDSLSPCAVFIDEYDGMMPNRETLVSGDSGTTQRMLTSFLSWLGSEKRTAFVITTTNQIEAVDKAAKRPGRVGKIVLVITPTRAAREEILKIHLKGVQVKQKVDLGEIASKTEFYTGDDLRQLVKEATAIAMDEQAPVITTAHFTSAMKYISVNAREREKTVAGMIKQAKSEESVDQRFINDIEKEFNAEREGLDQSSGRVGSV